jgi:hypothetical protein
MSTCPKCSFALDPGAAECPACGVILAKAKPREAPAAAASRPEPEPAKPEDLYVPGTVYSPASAFADGDLITTKTLDALGTVRPWLRFLVGYGFVMLALMILGSVIMMVAGASGTQGEWGMLSLVYLFYAIIMIALLLPLKRSSDAIRGIPLRGATSGLEAFVTEQATFWRRAGLLTAVSVVLMVLVFGFGVMAAFLGP